ncbi:MAG TPA: pitrilysin family protein [Vicinamibacterales bacterium]|nr:pitrilysin family protein [Vicinamibacterales bacterium]
MIAVTMTRARRLTALAVMLAAIPAAAQQPPDRTKPPTLGPAPVLTLPAVHKLVLANGLRVWVLEQHEVPLVQANLVVLSGASADVPGQFGVASMTAAMLDEGAAGKAALAVADSIEFLGAQLSAAAGFDASTVRLSTPATKLREALDVLADVAFAPDFPAEELERLRAERLTGLLQARDDASALVAMAYPRLLFGPEHRYGTSVVGTETSIRALGVNQLRDYHRSHYRPDNAVLIVVGDVTPEALTPLLDARFGTWRAEGPAAAPFPVRASPQPAARRIYLVDKPGAAQSQIRIGLVGVPRSTPDYIALDVLNTILGGSFTSRLNQNLRERNGYTYGASSRFDMRRSAGPFQAGAGVQTDKTAEALTEFFNELTAMLAPVPADELEKAKNYAALSFGGEFETTRQLAAKLEEIAVYGLPDDVFTKYVGAVQAITAADLTRAAKQYLLLDHMAVVIVGDRARIESGIRATNLGPVTVVPVADVLK